jgi:hypothetical protein
MICKLRLAIQLFPVNVEHVADEQNVCGENHRPVANHWQTSSHIQENKTYINAVVNLLEKL